MLQVHQGLDSGVYWEPTVHTLRLKGFLKASSFQGVMPSLKGLWSKHMVPWSKVSQSIHGHKISSLILSNVCRVWRPHFTTKNSFLPVFFCGSWTNWRSTRKSNQGHRARQAADSRTWSLVALSELPANVAASLCWNHANKNSTFSYFFLEEDRS